MTKREILIAIALIVGSGWFGYDKGKTDGYNRGFTAGHAAGKLEAKVAPDPEPTPAKPRPFWREDGTPVDECGDPIPFREATDEEAEYPEYIHYFG